MKPQVYIDPRPAEYFDKFHQRTRTRRPDWVYRLARLVLTFPVLTIYRFRGINLDNVPASGPVQSRLLDKSELMPFLKDN